MTTRSAAAAPLLIAALVGCGVTPDDGPRTIDPPGNPFRAHNSPTPATGAFPHTLYLVKDNKLVPVTRHVDTAPTPDSLVAALLAGPTTSERDQGITSALPGSAIVLAVRVNGSTATVELAVPVDRVPRTDEVLAYAQLVCTLTNHRGIAGVTFTRDGKPIGIPRADGSLSQGALTTADYTALIIATPK